MEDSLVKRLAGPSTGKAGLAKDQTEINRIIAEASKGSKFYDNEKRKDAELTQKIARLLKERDGLMKDVDVGKVEAALDRTLVELEAKRDLSQYIVHVDMDAFYASVELLDNPKLKDKAYGVGWSVLSTASYEARKFGVRSGMPGFIAKKLCPHLIFLRLRMDRYSELSKKVMEVFRRYDPDMQPGGIDEAYLNITKYCQEHNISPEDCVQDLRRAVQEEVQLTVSAGIAPNKMLAKICSDKNKPNGQFHLRFDRDTIMEFMRELPIRKIPGIGRVTERLLDSIGVKTCSDIYVHRATLSLMDKQFHLHSLLLTYLGIASNVVQAGQRHERKSIGSERTFKPISDSKEILRKLLECAEELEADMAETGWAGSTITLKYKLDTYQVFTRAKSSSKLITSKEDLFAIGKGLLTPELPLNIRLIGLRVTKLKDLRAADAKGLKRYFEPVGNSPSKKRRKIEEEEDEEAELDASQKRMEEEKAMAECEDEDQTMIVEEEGDIQGENSNISGKPVSSSAQQAGINDSPRAYKGRSSNPISRNTSSDTEQQCPICSKTLNTDNAGLNEHIDFCLSKGAIMAATVVRR
ncbi:hypothetical protein M422DRAFT_27916 [Sphaerobolus stellatus SS14]|nr:hypothetical protein M422DRAFT_27916 [Sphaerobolus stellatus SS14]